MKITETNYSASSGDAVTVGGTHSHPEEARAEPSTLPEIEHQAELVYKDNLSEREKMCMEQVVCKENMLAACHRVVGHGGSSGVDGMSVNDLSAYIREHWDLLRESLLEDSY